MTAPLNVTRNAEGLFEITDQDGRVIEGPFETNAAAWRALDRLGNEPEVPKRRKTHNVLWGKPQAKSKKVRRKEKRQKAREDNKLKVNAAKAPTWIRKVAGAKFDPAGERAYRDHKFGTFGAASEVKRIDPAEYLAMKARGDA